MNLQASMARSNVILSWILFIIFGTGLLFHEQMHPILNFEHSLLFWWLTTFIVLTNAIQCTIRYRQGKKKFRSKEETNEEEI